MSSIASAATFTSNATTGNWNVSGSWTLNSGTDADGIPDSDDNVTIRAGDTITVTAAASALSLTFSNTGNAANLTISSTNSLSVGAGGITVNAADTNNQTNTLNVGAGILSVTGGLSIFDGTGQRKSLLTVSTGSVTVTGNIAVTNISGNANASIVFSGAGTLAVAGNWTQNGPFTASSSTVTFNGTSGQTRDGSTAMVFFNLTMSNASGVTLAIGSGSATVNGTLALSSGTLTNNSTLTLGNGATISRDTGSLSGTAPTFGTSVNVTYTGTTGVTSGNEIPSSASVLNNLTINKSGGVALNASATVNGILTLTSGDISTGANTLNMSSTATSAGTTDVVGNVSRTHTFTTLTAYAFGNPFVTINFSGLGTKPTSMNVNLSKGSAPSNFTNAVNRFYSITNTGGAGFSAALQLRYLDAELNGNSEATLQLWRESAATWSAQGSTTLDSTNNFVSLTPVTAFSRWTIAGPNAPTDVTLLGLKATRHEARVLLEWQTGYEVSNVGFNIYREQKGKMIKINPEPVAGSALSFGPSVALNAGFAYSWWDNDPQDGNDTQYWLEDLDLSGRTAVHGPYGIEQSSIEKAPSIEKGKSPALSALGKSASRLGFSSQVERLARPARPTAKQLDSQKFSLSNLAVKFSIKNEGWYRVSQPDLVNAGLSSNVNPQKLQLIVDGQEVPIIVTGESDGSFDSSDAVEFYGIGIDSAFTSNHIYFLLAGSQNGLRIHQAPAQSGTLAPPSFAYIVERRDKVVYFSALKNGGGEKFFGPVIFNAQPIDQSVTIQHLAASPTLATLEVSLQGFTDVPHSVRVLLNGTELGTVQFNGNVKGTAQYSVPQSSLVEGSNQILFISPAGFSDISMVEYVRLTYQHSNTADGNAIRFPITGTQQTTIGGFTSSAVRVLDVTNPNSPQELTPTVAENDSEYAATVGVPSAGNRTLFAFTPDQHRTPAAITLNRASSWRSAAQAADYVAVTRRDLIDSIQPLVSHRRKQGQKTALIDIEDIYDEFSFGNKSPQALKDFFAYAKTTWKRAPKFALLAGDATFDPKNYLGAGDFDLVPTKLVETAFNETATDDWFVDTNDDGVPDIAVGRLPVRTPADADAIGAKIISYDSYEGSNRVLLLTDTNSGYDFEAADTLLQSVIPANLTVTGIRRSQVGDANARSQLLDGINQGSKIVNYYGHGSVLVWTNAQILKAADAANLSNQERLTFFDAMTCLSGLFQDVSIDGLGEALLKGSGGAVAVWASSGMTDPSAQVEMNQQAIQLLLSDPTLTIGEVTKQAKAATNNSDVRKTWILLGDPATKLK